MPSWSWLLVVSEKRTFLFGFGRASGGFWTVLPPLIPSNVWTCAKCVFWWTVCHRNAQKTEQQSSSCVELWRRLSGTVESRKSSDSRQGSDGFHWESLYLFIGYWALLLHLSSLYRLKYNTAHSNLAMQKVSKNGLTSIKPQQSYFFYWVPFSFVISTLNFEGRKDKSNGCCEKFELHVSQLSWWIVVDHL